MARSRKIGWHRADIIAAVRKKGDTLAGLGRRSGMSRQHLSLALVEPRPRANRAIADFLGLPLSTIWPQWFAPDGTLISRKAITRPGGDRITRPSTPASELGTDS